MQLLAQDTPFIGHNSNNVTKVDWLRERSIGRSVGVADIVSVGRRQCDISANKPKKEKKIKIITNTQGNASARRA